MSTADDELPARVAPLRADLDTAITALDIAKGSLEEVVERYEPAP